AVARPGPLGNGNHVAGHAFRRIGGPGRREGAGRRVHRRSTAGRAGAYPLPVQATPRPAARGPHRRRTLGTERRRGTESGTATRSGRRSGRDDAPGDAHPFEHLVAGAWTRGGGGGRERRGNGRTDGGGGIEAGRGKA